MIAARARTVLAVAVMLVCVAAGAETPVAPVAPAAGYHSGYRLVHVPRTGQEALLVAVWYPTEAGPGRVSYPLPVRALEGQATQDARPAAEPFPLIIYSHGAGGCGIMAAGYAEALAEAGFVVAAPDHGDEFQVCSSDGKVTADRERALQWLQWAEGGSRARYDGRPSFKYAHRPPEVKAAITYLLGQSADAASDLHGLIEPDRIGIMGVSFGAWTTQAMAGFYGGLYRDDRIKAALPIAGTPVPGPGSLANIKVPLMMVFGQKETMALMDNSTPLKTEGMARDYGTANAPKYLVGVAGVNHLDFGPTGVVGSHSGTGPISMAQVRRDDVCVRAVDHYAVAFLKRYLKDDRSAEADLAAGTADIFLFRADPGGGTK